MKKSPQRRAAGFRPVETKGCALALDDLAVVTIEHTMPGERKNWTTIRLASATGFIVRKGYASAARVKRKDAYAIYFRLITRDLALILDESMIVTRSPLRIDIAGGITDLPCYYRHHTGFMIAAAIDKHIYISVNQRFGPELVARYSKVEIVESARDLEHPIIRECLCLLGMEGKSLEICSIADVPAGTGLGSSGSFTTALLKALHAYNKNTIAPDQLAEQAFDVETIRLKEEGGKQDQYIAAFGGIKGLRFLHNGSSEIESLKVSDDTVQHLEENLLLFFAGYCRSASAVLKTQRCRIEENDPTMMKHMHWVKDIAFRTRKALESGDFAEFVRLMDEHWESKRQRCENMSNPRIDEWYDLAKANGAGGGSLLGAGGGGFLMFYANDKDRLRRTMRAAGLRELRFRFDFEGTKLLTW